MIYFAQAENGGPVKIGYSSRPDVRVRSLSRALRVLKVKNGDKAAEHAIHERLREYRIDGEWFEPSDNVFKVMNEPDREEKSRGERLELAVRECVTVLLKAAFSGPAEMAAAAQVTRRCADNWWAGRNMPGVEEMLALGKASEIVRLWWRGMLSATDPEKFAHDIATFLASRGRS